MMRDSHGLDALEILQRYVAWRRAESISLQAPAHADEAIDSIIAEVTRLREVEMAARNLLVVKGSANTLIAFNTLAETLK